MQKRTIDIAPTPWHIQSRALQCKNGIRFGTTTCMQILYLQGPPLGEGAHPDCLALSAWARMIKASSQCYSEQGFYACRRVFCHTGVVGVILHEGGVTELQVQKPRLIRKGFRSVSGRAGQFCFLNIPELSRFEWHPFSLTSGKIQKQQLHFLEH